MILRRNLIALASAAGVLAACKPAGSAGASAAAAQLQRINSDKILRAGFINYPPSLIVPPGSATPQSGIMFDVMNEIAARAKLSVTYGQDLDWQRMIEAVDTDQADVVVSGIWPDSFRALRADFSRAVYFSRVYAFVRPGDTRFDGNLAAADLQTVKVATLDGEISDSIARADLPHAGRQSLPQGQDISQLLLQLTSNRADITFVEAAVAHAYLQKNPGAVRQVRLAEPVRVFPNTFLVRKGAQPLLGFLNVAIDELNNNGFITATLRKYDPDGTLFLRPALPYRL